VCVYARVGGQVGVVERERGSTVGMAIGGARLGYRASSHLPSVLTIRVRDAMDIQFI
jgi:hypothetical protein